MNESELDLLLGEMRDEELPAGALAGVRARVRERLHARRRLWVAAWICAPAALAVAALAIAVFSPNILRPVRGPELARRTPGVPEIALQRFPAPAIHREITTKSRATRGENAVIPRSGEPAVERTEFIKIYTDDPDVVILWAMNSKGETR